MTNHAKTAVAGILALALLASALPPATAQAGAASFGSKVAFGDSDFIPQLVVTGTVPIATGAGVGFCRLQLNDQTLVTDDGYYVFAVPGAGLPATLPVNAIRIFPILGKVAGSLVTDADTVERGAACIGGSTGVAFAVAAFTNIWFVNFDQVAGYTAGDCVYLDRDASGTFTRWDIRLTPCTVGSANYAAGTLVELGDADLVNAPGGAAAPTPFPAGAWKAWDSQPNAILDANDRLYASSVPLGTASQPTNNDVRILGGVFGSKVVIGDNDFRPALIAAAGGTLPANILFCRVNLGDTALQTDDGHYLVSTATAAGTVTFTLPVNALRLTAAAGKAAGTLVQEADVIEIGKACADVDAGGVLTASPSTIGFGAIIAGATNVYTLNFDQVGGFTSGDCVYLDVGAPAAVTGTVSRWDVRLTKCVIGSTTYNAGTLMELGDLDLVNSPGAICLSGVACPAGPVFKVGDSQPNAIIDSGDLLYASSVSVAAANRPFTNDVRLLGGNQASLTFGSLVKAGDIDFVPTLTALPAGLATMVFCRIQLGDTSLVTDDGYYIGARAGAGATTVFVNDMRLITVLGKAAGTMVSDADTTEIGKACIAPGGGVAVGFTAGGLTDIFVENFDQIAVPAYTSGDCVYLNRDGVAGLQRWDIRLSKCIIGSTTYNAGTLVELGDLDLTNAPVAGVGFVAFKHWDAQPNVLVDNMDRLYVSTTPLAGITNLPGVNDIRLFGDLTVAQVTPPPPPPPPCPAGQTRNAQGTCVPTEQVPCPTGQTRDASGNCVPPETTSMQLQTLIQQVAALSGQLNQSLAQNAQLQGQISSLNTQLSNQTAQLTTLNSQISSLQTENADLKKKLEEKDKAQKTPGFEAIAVLAALGVAVLVLRRRD